MANIFVWSGATGLNDGTKWEDAFTAIGRDYGPLLTPGTDFVYVRGTHAESTAVIQHIVGSSVFSVAPVRIICVVGNDTGTTPGNLTTGATVTTTGNNNEIQFSEKLYVYGIDFISGDGVVCGQNQAENDITIEQGRLEITSDNNNDNFEFGNGSAGVSSVVRLIDTDIDFPGTAPDFVVRQGIFIWDGGTLIAATGTLIGLSESCNVYFRNVDLSLQQNILLASGVSNRGVTKVHLDRCLVHATVDFVNGTLDQRAGSYLQATHCQNGTDADPTFQMHLETQNGTVAVDTARYRTGGASDGERTNPVSWDMNTVATMSIETYEAVISPPISAWTDGDASTAHVYRVHVASGGTLNNDDLWIEITGPNSAATNSLGERTSTRMAPLGTPTALTTDSGSTWTGADVGTLQYAQVSYTPDKPGPVTCRVYLAQPSQRVSVDPVIVIDP